jgi:hypothetical protein
MCEAGNPEVLARSYPRSASAATAPGFADLHAVAKKQRNFALRPCLEAKRMGDICRPLENKGAKQRGAEIGSAGREARAMSSRREADAS